MKQKGFLQFSCLALVAGGFGLNIQNALADYGMNKDATSLVVSSFSNSGDSSNGTSNRTFNNSSNVPNGNVRVLSLFKTCYDIVQTDKKMILEYKNPETGETREITQVWYEYRTFNYYDCTLVDNHNVGWCELCREPNFFDETQCSMTEKPKYYKNKGHWVSILERIKN